MIVLRAVPATVAMCLVGLLIAPRAHAQRHFAEVRIDQMQPASPGSPFTRAEGPHEVFEEGIGWGLRTTVDYGFRPLVSRYLGVDTEPVPLVEHAMLLHLGAAIDPLHWLRAELSIPFALWEEGEDELRQGNPTIVDGQDKPAGQAPAQGDLRIGAHIRPYTTKETDWSIGVRAWAPTGDKSAYLAGKDGFFRIELVPAVSGEIDVVLYGCTLGLAPMFFAGRDGDRLAASGAVHFKVAPFVTVGLEPHLAIFSFGDFREDEAEGDLTAKKQVPGLGDAVVRVQFEPMAAAMFKVGDFNAGVAIGPGFSNAPGSPQVRALLTLQYASLTAPKKVERPPPDDDLDGLVNAYDACPTQAGPKDQRGCPSERDLDGDGIIEGDACPKELGARSSDPKANGCPDRDNDHYPDPVDPCPTEPGAETEGCPKYARLEKGQFAVTPPISFVGGTTKLSNEGRAAIVEIIRTMRANPKIELVSVSIGTRGAPPRLTDQRAKEILTLFDDQNFPSDRFEVVLNDDLRGGQVAVRVVR